MPVPREQLHDGSCQMPPAAVLDDEDQATLLRAKRARLRAELARVEGELARLERPARQAAVMEQRAAAFAADTP